MNELFLKGQSFIYKNARPIDLMLWKYHFENGSKEMVLKYLKSYQNTDGGFGNGLEPDCFNPNSSPIQTWAATEILWQINYSDSSHHIIKGILDYLKSGKDFEDGYWLNSVASNNDYPHASWWHKNETVRDIGAFNPNINPSCALAGFIIRYSRKDSKLYELGKTIANKAYEAYMREDYINDMHVVLCLIRMLEYIENAKAYDIFDVFSLRSKLINQVKFNITKDKRKWENEYICRPSYFFNSIESQFYKGNEKIAKYECDFIKRTQLADGSYIVPWEWNDYKESFAIARNWWKSNIIIKNLLFLQGIDNTLY